MEAEAQVALMRPGYESLGDVRDAALKHEAEAGELRRELNHLADKYAEKTRDLEAASAHGGSAAAQASELRATCERLAVEGESAEAQRAAFSADNKRLHAELSAVQQKLTELAILSEQDRAASAAELANAQLAKQAAEVCVG